MLKIHGQYTQKNDYVLKQKEQAMLKVPGEYRKYRPINIQTETKLACSLKERQLACSMKYLACDDINGKQKTKHLIPYTGYTWY